LLQYRGIARHDLGDIGDGVQDIRAGLELGREQGDLSTVGIGYSNLASILLSRSAQESADAYREGIDFTKARGMNGNARWLMAEHTWPLYDLGRWDEIVRDADILFEAGLGRGYLTIIALTQKALVLVQRGRTEEAAPLVDDVLPRAREAKDLQVLVPALATAAALAVAAGQLGSAAALVREVEEITREGAAALRARHLPDLVSIAFLAGVSDTANSFLDANYFDAGRPAHAMVAARAVVAEFNDKPAEAVELYEDAAARWSEYGSVLERANALFGAGRSLLALGRPHEATARLQEARTLYQDLGAAPSVGRVDDALARATSVSA
jgi:tetratricopeptide (TPR) repeat protein